jgi:hypothetical protein
MKFTKNVLKTYHFLLVFINLKNQKNNDKTLLWTPVKKTNSSR